MKAPKSSLPQPWAAIIAPTRTYLSYIGCAAVLCIVAVWRLGDTTFWDPDEAHYAQTSRELIRTGDWAAPYYNQQPFFDKPIFFHWKEPIISNSMLAMPNRPRIII